MIDWWSDNGPPVYVSAASYLGLIKTGKKRKQSGSSSAKPADPGNLNELLKLAGAGGMIQ